mmetsp:Transcript_1885/g.6135  ORF Transcript_1885/g.6135 Transcript_1885/m.6135 type:complete len:217 (-) Transcript_1885:55-705(-)
MSALCARSRGASKIGSPAAPSARSRFSPSGSGSSASSSARAGSFALAPTCSTSSTAGACGGMAWARTSSSSRARSMTTSRASRSTTVRRAPATAPSRPSVRKTSSSRLRPCRPRSRLRPREQQAAWPGRRPSNRRCHRRRCRSRRRLARTRSTGALTCLTSSTTDNYNGEVPKWPLQSSRATRFASTPSLECSCSLAMSSVRLLVKFSSKRSTELM